VSSTEPRASASKPKGEPQFLLDDGVVPIDGSVERLEHGKADEGEVMGWSGRREAMRWEKIGA
jgi:hypothetical protein